MKLIDNWKRELLRLHSMRVAIGSGLVWSGIGGAIMVWPALAEHIPIEAYVVGGIALSIAFGVARVLKQPGTEN
jgi:hypothetical protein